ncbi:hypothetical protein MASR2M12_12080 [Bacteroidales bacterium]
MKKKELIIIGVILVIAAVTVNIVGSSYYLEQSMHMEGHEQAVHRYLMENIVTYGGFGVGAIGIVILLAGLLKNSKE